MKRLITVLSLWVATSAPIFAQNQDSVNAAWVKYIETGKIEEKPIAKSKKAKGFKLDPSLGNAPTGTSTGTALPIAPDGYGTDPGDKNMNVLPKKYDQDGSKMREARATYKEAHKYDIDSPNTLVGIIAILITIGLFFFIRKGILREERVKKAEINSISEKQKVSNVSSTSSYQISYSNNSKKNPA